MEKDQELKKQLIKLKKMRTTNLFLRIMMSGFFIVLIGFFSYSMYIPAAFVLGIMFKLAYDMEQHSFSIKLEKIMLSLIKDASKSTNSEVPTFLK